MGFIDWAKQTAGNAKNWVKQTAGKAASGMNWLNQNIIQPGVKMAGQLGGDVGKVAEQIGTAANTLDDVGQKYQSGKLGVSDLKSAYQNLKGAADRGRSSAGGAAAQIKGAISGGIRGEMDKVKTLVKNKDVTGAMNYGKDLKRKAEDIYGPYMKHLAPKPGIRKY